MLPEVDYRGVLTESDLVQRYKIGIGGAALSLIRKYIYLKCPQSGADSRALRSLWIQQVENKK